MLFRKAAPVLLWILGSSAFAGHEARFSAPERGGYWSDFNINSLNLSIYNETPTLIAARQTDSGKARWFFPCTQTCRVHSANSNNILTYNYRPGVNQVNVVALDPQTGQERWTRTDVAWTAPAGYFGATPFSPEPVTGISYGKSYEFIDVGGKSIRTFTFEHQVTAAPIIHGQTIMWGLEGGSVVAMNADGTTAWTWQYGENAEIRDLVRRFYIIAPHILAVAMKIEHSPSSTDLYFIDTNTHKTIKSLPSFNSGAFTQDASHFYVGSEFNLLSAYNRDDLELVWQSRLPERRDWINNLWIAGDHIVSAYARKVQLYNKKTGAQLDSVAIQSQCFINKATFIEPNLIIPHEYCSIGEAGPDWFSFSKISILN